MASIQEKTCDKAAEAVDSNIRFPSWDQLPADFQNPTTSADYNSGIPISTTDTSMLEMEGTTDSSMRWEDTELNFDMEMEMDLDVDLDMLSK